jgi:hypothetical protein
VNLLLRDFAGDSIYLDTMSPYALLRGFDERVHVAFATPNGAAVTLSACS